MLKASCPQGELHEVLQVVSRGVSGRSTQPVQNHIHLSNSDGKLRLVATDLEYLSLDATLPAEIQEEGAVTVPGRIFNEIIATLPDEEVTLEAEQGELTIRCGRSRYQVRGLPAADFQMFPEFAPEVEFSLPEAALQEVLAQTIFACASDETRPVLTGALFFIQPTGVTVVATDMYRLALRTLACATGVEDEKKVIVSARILGELARLLKAGSQDPVAIKLTQRMVYFEVGNVKLASRLIEGEFPNYPKVVPEKHDKTVRAQVEPLERALRRALIVARDDSYRVLLAAEGSRLQISATAPDVGSVEEEVEIALEGEGLQIAFNARFMMDFLDVIAGSEIRMEFNGSLNPGTLRPGVGDDYLYVLMPMQIMT
jgi:DNA polymerase-3 subunit beta